MTIAESQPAAAEPKRRWYRVTPDRMVWLLLVVEGLLWLAERFHGFPKGYAVLLAVASVAAAMLLMLLWFAASLVFRWRFQFSIGSLLVLAVVVALLGGWLTVEIKEAKEQREAVSRLRMANAFVGYDFEVWDYDGSAPVPPASPWITDPPTSPPAWLRDLLGDDFVSDVVQAQVVGDAGMPYLKGLRRLRKLYLANVTDDVTDSIVELSRLRMVDLSDQRQITNKLLEKLKTLDALQEIDDHEATDAELELLKALPRLERLDLSRSKISDAGLTHLKALPGLQRLDLGGTHITDSGLKHLFALEGLEWLELDGTPITDAGVEHLKSLRRLTCLELSWTAVTDATSERLKGLPRLECLGIADALIGDTGLAQLTFAPRLRELRLDRRALTMAGVKHLRAMPQLRKLVFQFGVTDEDAELLEGLPQLQILEFVNPHTTPKALKRVVRALPNCKVFMNGERI
jgi:hypothetical protein